MKHIEGDVVQPRDCIVLASGHRKRDLPFIAKVTSLWENPEDGKIFRLSLCLQYLKCDIICLTIIASKIICFISIF